MQSQSKQTSSNLLEIFYLSCIANKLITIAKIKLMTNLFDIIESISKIKTKEHENQTRNFTISFDCAFHTE